MLEYRHRVLDDELDQLLPELPALSIEGPKGVGKTETARRRAATCHELDRPETLELARADPARLLAGAEPILIDEWQRFPASWDLVRRSVDRDGRPGRFILTGSASPLAPGTHSGAGRIVTVRMRPLSLTERDVQQPTVSLASLLAGDKPPIAGSTSVGLTGYVNEILIGGFPGMRGHQGRGQRARLGGYIDRIVDHDFPEFGRTVRKPGTLRRWLAAYAAATATATSYEKIRDAATAGESDKPAHTTTAQYRDILERLWIVEPIPGWSPSHNHLARLMDSPKHHLADPALATRILGLDAEALLEGGDGGIPIPRDGTFLGALFESLVALDVRVFAQAAEATVHHLRQYSGAHEIDFVVARGDQKVVAIETKLARTIVDADVRHLRWLAKRIGADLLDAVVINTGSSAYRRQDGIAVVPAALLGP